MIATTFDLQGHRGARGLAPENTLPAFDRALAIGVTTLELDTAITRDGVVVVAHDRRLNPDITRNRNGHWVRPPAPAIHHLDYAQLLEYDVGRINPESPYARRFPEQVGADDIRMPRLADVFALTKNHDATMVRFNIETKLSPLFPEESPSPEAFVSRLLEVIASAGVAARTTIQSFDWRTLRIAAQTSAEISLSFLTTQQPGENTLDTQPRATWTDGTHLDEHGSVPRMIAARIPPGWRHSASPSRRIIWSPNHRDLTSQSLREAHHLGIEVVPWTVNEDADIRQIIESGADGLITDYPDRAKTILNRY